MAYKAQHWDWAQTEITSPILTFRSVIDYYNKRGATANLCMLDISKAFGRVNHYCMFIICPMSQQHWTDYKISLCVSQSVSEFSDPLHISRTVQPRNFKFGTQIGHWAT